MIDAETISELAAAGFTGEQIAFVAKVFQRKDEERKRKDRERKRASKEFHGNPRNSTEGTGNPRTSAEIQEKVSPPSLSPIPPITTSSSPESPSARAQGTRLSENWEPSQEDWEWGKAQGLDDDQLREITAEFKDYWCAVPGSRGRKLKWGATWRNSVRRFLGKMKGQFNGKTARPNSIAAGFARITAAIERQFPAVEDAGGEGGYGEIVEILPRLREGT